MSLLLLGVLRALLLDLRLVARVPGGLARGDLVVQVRLQVGDLLVQAAASGQRLASEVLAAAGQRGTGKTSAARILARNLNCVDGPTTTPCG